MKIIGKVHKVLAPVEGVSQNGAWIRRTLVIQALESERFLAIDFGTEDWSKKLDFLKPGMLVEVRCEPESRPSTTDESKWFTSIKGWGLETFNKQ